MSEVSACKVSAPWYVHPYFAALLLAGAVILSSLILKHLEPTGALPFWELLRRKAELLPS